MTSQEAGAPLEERIFALLRETVAVPTDRLTPQTRLNSDLEVTGDDADDLFMAYAKRFGVDLSEFRFLDHFEWESYIFGRDFYLALASLFSRKIRDTLRAARARESDITIQHLIDCARTKRWRRPADIPFERKTPPLWTLPLWHVWAMIRALIPVCLLAAFVIGAMWSSGANFRHLGTVGAILFPSAAILGLEIWSTISWYRAKTKDFGE